MSTPDAARLVVLRSEIEERIREVMQIIGPERTPILLPALAAVRRECSRGYAAAGKEGLS